MLLKLTVVTNTAGYKYEFMKKILSMSYVVTVACKKQIALETLGLKSQVASKSSKVIKITYRLTSSLVIVHTILISWLVLKILLN